MTVVTREFKIRSVDEETRTIEGIAIPYDVTIDVPAEGIKERIARGAFGTPDSVPFYLEHSWLKKSDPRSIGEVFSFEDTDDGLSIKARFATHSKAEAAYQQALKGELNSFSSSFETIEDLVDGDVVTRNKADLLEVSLVKAGGYPTAKVTQVRDLNSTKEVSANMDTNVQTSEDVTELRAEVTNLKRELATLAQGGNKENAVVTRSAADLVMAAHNGDEDAKKVIARAYTSATSADSHTGNDWHANLLTIVNNGRPLVEAFQRDALGQSGMTVTYPKISALTGAASALANEGDDFNYLEVVITEGTSPVKIYGGWSEMTRAAIERSDVPYLAKALEWQAASYATETHKAVRTAMTGATPQTGTSFTLSSATSQDFLKAVIDGKQKIYKNGVGARAEFVVVSDDVLLQMGSLTDGASGTGRPLFPTDGQSVNSLGVSDVTVIVGSIAGLPVVWDTGLSAKTMYVASSQAVTTWEASGVPFRIETTNAKNASNQYGLYGYMAVGVTNANGLVKPTVA